MKGQRQTRCPVCKYYLFPSEYGQAPEVQPRSIVDLWDCVDTTLSIMCNRHVASVVAILSSMQLKVVRGTKTDAFGKTFQMFGCKFTEIEPPDTEVTAFVMRARADGNDYIIETGDHWMALKNGVLFDNKGSKDYIIKRIWEQQ